MLLIMDLNKQFMDYIVIFENLTTVHVKDCFENNGRLVFIVESNKVVEAIGKNACNVLRLEKILKHKIKIVEYNPDPCRFVKSWIAPIKADSVVMEDDKVVISIADVRGKGLLIGRDRKNIKNLVDVAGRYYNGLEVEIR